MKNKKKPNLIWVKINRGSVKTDEDSCTLTDIQIKHHANFNTDGERAMHFDFRCNKDAIGFAAAVVKTFPYLTVTFGQGSQPEPLAVKRRLRSAN